MDTLLDKSLTLHESYKKHQNTIEGIKIKSKTLICHYHGTE